MELASFIWTLLALVVATLLAFSNRLLLGKSMFKKLPPGNLGWPILGDSIAFFRSMDSANPYRFHNLRRKWFGDTFLTNYFGITAVVVSSADVAKDILLSDSVENGYFESTRQMLGTESLIVLSGQKHARLRKAVQIFMMPEKLKSLLHVIEDSAEMGLRSAEGLETDAVELHRTYALNVVCNILLGSVPPQLEKVLRREYPWIKKGLFSVPIDLPGTTYRKCLQARKRIDICIQQAIESKREQLKDIVAGSGSQSIDLISYLIDCHKVDGGDPLSDKEMRDLFMTMLIAGIDTTAMNMSFGMKWLDENPDTLKEVREEQMAIRQRIGPGTPLSWKDLKEMHVTLKVLQETVRLTVSPFSLLRRANEDIPVKGGYVIPKGMTIDVSVINLHTDTRMFGPEVDKFCISRWKDIQTLPPAQFVAFGYGPRACVGMELAKFEILTFYHYLLTNYSYEVTSNPSIGFIPEGSFKSGLKIRLHRLQTS